MTMIPIVASAADIDEGLQYAQKHPNARWYVSRRLEALDAADQIPEEWGLTAARMPRLGTGKRFSNLKSSLAKRGVNNPGALAAWIGRKKFGKAKFAKLGARARTAAVTAAAGDEGGTPGQPSAGWLRRVRAEINEAGVDPDYIEATLPGGFASAYDGMDAVTFAEQLLDTYAESIADEFPELLQGDDGDDEDQADDAEATEGDEAAEPQAPAAPVEKADPSAPATTAVPVAASSGQTFNIYTHEQPQVASQSEAVLASVREIVQSEIQALLAAAPPKIDDEEDLADQGADEATEDAGPDAGPVDEGAGPPLDDTVPVPPGPDGGAPVENVDDAKAKLRQRFGGKKAPPVAASGGTVAPATPVDTVKRRPMTAAATRSRLAEARKG